MPSSETIYSTPTLASVAGTNRLPSLPVVVQRMLELAQQDEPEYRDICQVIRSDPAVSGRVLKTVNSALFGLRPKVIAIEDAVPRLGVSTIRTLILSFHLSTWKPESGDAKAIFRSIWRRCLTQAVIAELLAEKTNQDGAACFSGGMIQDIGILAMVTELGDDYVNEVFKKHDFLDIVNAENAKFGFNHIDVSVEILKRWNMEETFIDAVRTHHAANGKSESTSHQNKLIPIMQAARLGASVFASGRKSGKIGVAINEWMRFLNCQFGFNPEDVNEIISEIEERVIEYSVIFKFDIQDGSSCEQVIEKAKQLLQDIALQSQLKVVALKKSEPVSEVCNAAFHDYLSGLYNRRFLNEGMNQHFDSWIKKRKPIAMLYLDVDKFKNINDELGHDVGDAAILHVAQWLLKCTRENDFVFRLGGDEFLIAMQVKEKYCNSIATRLAKDIPDLKTPEGVSVPVSLSVGAVLFQPKRGEKEFDAQALIKAADAQMYRAKDAGGNCAAFQVFE